MPAADQQQVALVGRRARRPQPVQVVEHQRRSERRSACPRSAGARAAAGPQRPEVDALRLLAQATQGHTRPAAAQQAAMISVAG